MPGACTESGLKPYRWPEVNLKKWQRPDDVIFLFFQLRRIRPKNVGFTLEMMCLIWFWSQISITCNKKWKNWLFFQQPIVYKYDIFPGLSGYWSGLKLPSVHAADTLLYEEKTVWLYLKSVVLRFWLSKRNLTQVFRGFQEKILQDSQVLDWPIGVKTNFSIMSA